MKLQWMSEWRMARGRSFRTASAVGKLARLAKAKNEPLVPKLDAQVG
jgi:hypothetical protein